MNIPFPLLQKTADNLQTKTEELSVWGVQEEERPCVIKMRESNDDGDTFACDITGTHSTAFKAIKVIFFILFALAA